MAFAQPFGTDTAQFRDRQYSLDERRRFGYGYLLRSRESSPGLFLFEVDRRNEVREKE